MLINTISFANPNTKQTFGAEYSDALIPGMGKYSDRVFDITSKREKNFSKEMKYFKQDFEAWQQMVDPVAYGKEKERLARKHEELKKLHDSRDIYKKAMRENLVEIDKYFPTEEIYPYFNPHTKKTYFAINVEGTPHMLAPIRTFNNANPMENPDAIRIANADLAQVAKSLKRVEKFYRWSGKIKKLFQMHF